MSSLYFAARKSPPAFNCEQGEKRRDTEVDPKVAGEDGWIGIVGGESAFPTSRVPHIDAVVAPISPVVRELENGHGEDSLLV
jgi:hypothetical protein